MVVSRFDVYLIRLDPTQGREIRKTRPCLIISPDEMNQHIDTVIIAPMTTGPPLPHPCAGAVQRQVGSNRVGSNQDRG